MACSIRVHFIAIGNHILSWFLSTLYSSIKPKVISCSPAFVFAATVHTVARVVVPVVYSVFSFLPPSNSFSGIYTNKQPLFVHPNGYNSACIDMSVSGLQLIKE